MLRGALIGLGNVAVGVHLPGWARRGDVTIVGVTDTRAERRPSVEAVLPGARWYASADALLDDGALDFVDICTPPSSHAALIRAALERGVHVMCEKPLVGSPAELAPLARLATTGKLALHTVHNWHHAPIVRRTWELVRKGAIGRVIRVVWQTLRTKPAATQDEDQGNWRLDPAVAGGGVLTDHGWHVFYILQAWVGELPTAVSARLETRRHTQYPVEDTATVQVTFPGATAEVLLTWAAETRDNVAEVIGTTGSIRLEDDVLVLRRAGEAEQRWTIPPALSNGSVHPDWFDPIATRFLADIRGGSPDPSNLVEASVCVALEAAARESSRRGGREIPLHSTALRGDGELTPPGAAF
jgi:predicted dehydrogenase